MSKGFIPYNSSLVRGIKYLTYTLHFPDGDIWLQQTPIVGDFDIELNNLIAGHHDKSLWISRCMQLAKHKTVWWKDAHGVEHILVIEKTKRRKRWGMGKTIHGSITEGVTDGT